VSVCAAARGAKQSGRTGRTLLPLQAAMAAEATVQAEHWLNFVRSRETDWENGYRGTRIDCHFLATSDPLDELTSFLRRVNWLPLFVHAIDLYQ